MTAGTCGVGGDRPPGTDGRVGRRISRAQSARLAGELSLVAVGVELPLAVAAGASPAGVSTVAEVVLGAWVGGAVVLGAWVGGTEATDPAAFASELGVEGTEAAGSAFEGCVLLVLAATESCFCASTLVFAEAGREADSRLERLEVLPLAAVLEAVFAAVVLFAGGGDALAALRLGACWVVASASATVTAFSRALVVAWAASGAEVFGAELLAFATVEDGAPIGRTVFSEPLRLWSISSAPPITVAVMAANAIPKWFMDSPGIFVDTTGTGRSPTGCRPGTRIRPRLRGRRRNTDTAVR